MDTGARRPVNFRELLTAACRRTGVSFNGGLAGAWGFFFVKFLRELKTFGTDI
jgi:hypothetical protein